MKEKFARKWRKFHKKPLNHAEGENCGKLTTFPKYPSFCVFFILFFSFKFHSLSYFPHKKHLDFDNLFCYTRIPPFQQNNILFLLIFLSFSTKHNTFPLFSDIIMNFPGNSFTFPFLDSDIPSKLSNSMNDKCDFSVKIS